MPQQMFIHTKIKHRPTLEKRDVSLLAGKRQFGQWSRLLP
jgi:hypothetical protein